MTTRAGELADRLELALRRLGRWSGAIDPALLIDAGPFGINTMTAEQWLEHVLIDRLRSGALPSESSISAWAVRNFDGDDQARPLLDVISEIDAMVNHPIRATATHAREFCMRLPMVAAAYLIQLHAPHANQLTTPALGLVLTGPLPADAFASWPAQLPLVVFALGDDAISRLARLTEPIYRAPQGPPPGVSDYEWYR